MKNRTKLIWIVIGAFVLLTAFRDTSVINFNFYRHTTSSMSNSNWTSIAKDSVKVKSMANVNASVIVMLDKDTLFSEIKSQPPIVVMIKSFQTGPTWVPLYKSTNYSATASVTNEEPMLTGNLTTDGKVVITGMCSNKEALAIIKKTVATNLANEVKKYLTSSK